MARKKPVPEYSKVTFDEVEGLEGCSVVFWVNFPLRVLNTLDSNQPSTLTDFLVLTIKDWEGFDMPLNRASIKELTMEEAKSMIPLMLAHVSNPQMRNKVDTSAG